MTYPSGPAAAYDYETFQAGSPSTPLPAVHVGADFANQKTATDSVIAFLKALARSDGRVLNGSIALESLSASLQSLIGGWTPKGAWTTATAYAVKDMADDGGNTYVCIVAHTSGTFATDLAAGKWALLSAHGVNAFATTAASFTMPASGSSVSVQMDDPSWMAAGQIVYVTTAGYMQVVSIDDATHATLKNLGYTGNAAGAATIAMAQEVSPAGLKGTDGTNGTNGTAGATGPDGSRNRIINGDFQIDQRNAGASLTLTAGAAVAYAMDRWYASCTGANVTIAQGSGPATFQLAALFTGAASNTGVLLGQRIESKNIVDLYGADVVVSFKVKSSALTSLTWTVYYATSTDNFSAKTQIATGTVTVTSSWASQSFTFNAGTNGPQGIAIEFTGGALIGSQTLSIADVQLEAGTVATTFERRKRNEQLAACMRYYQSYGGDDAAESFCWGSSISTTQTVYSMRLVQHMRAAPSGSVSAASNFSSYRTADGVTTALTALAFQNPSKTSIRMLGNVSSAASHYAQELRANSTSARLQLSAEL